MRKSGETGVNYQYTIVTKNNDRYGDINFVNRNSEKEVLHYVGIASSQSALDDNVTIERIIRMDEYGNTDKMEVVFVNGRLQLKLIPEVKQG